MRGISEPWKARRSWRWKIFCVVAGVKADKLPFYARHEDEDLTLILIPKGRYLSISNAERNCRILGTRIIDLEKVEDSDD